MPELVKVAETHDVPPGSAVAVECNGERVAIFNVDGQYHAMSDMCPHMGGPLSEGETDGESVTCPWHGWNFEFDGDEDDGVKRYKVVVDGNDVKLEVP